MIDIINELLDTTRFFLLLYVFFAERLEIQKKQLAIIGVFYAAGFVLMIVFGFETDLYILGTLIQITAVALFLREKWYEKILSFLVLFSLPSVAELAIEIVCRYFVGLEAFQGFLRGNYLLLGRLFSWILIGYIAYIVRKRNDHFYVSNMSKILLTLITLIFLITLSWMTSAGYEMDKVTSLLMSICCMVIGMICIWLLIVDSSRKKQTLNGERAKQYLLYIERLEKEQEEIRKIYHDLKHHINAISIFASENDVAEIKTYLRSLEMDIADRYEEASYTDNRLFNVILADKERIAREKGIAIKFKGSLRQTLNIADYDFSIVLSNLLDNALEYVVDSGFKEVEVYANQDEESIVIKITNPVKSEADIQVGMSNKSDSALHGFGLVNVKRAVEKYDGLLDLTIENNRFSAKVLMMNRK